jgi:hypothetical protein
MPNIHDPMIETCCVERGTIDVLNMAVMLLEGDGWHKDGTPIITQDSLDSLCARQYMWRMKRDS